MIKKILRRVKRLADRLLGTTADQWYWQLRHIFDDQTWAENYLAPESLEHPVRKIIIDLLAAYYPFQSVLEVGAASGPNLYLLAKRFPNVRYFGTDISGHAVTIGRNWLKRQGVEQIELTRAPAQNLRHFPNKSIDILFTNAILIYVGPEKIEVVIKEMCRVTRRALIFIEYHAASASAAGEYIEDHWTRNYISLLAPYIPPERISVKALPRGTFGGDWDKFGHIIEARFK